MPDSASGIPSHTLTEKAHRIENEIAVRSNRAGRKASRGSYFCGAGMRAD